MKEERILELLGRSPDRRIRAAGEKVVRGERLDFDDGLALAESEDLPRLGALANLVRERKNGDAGFYIVNRYLNPTNLCWVDCQLCAWARKPGEEGGYTLSIEEAVREAGKGWDGSVSEIHIVGGLHPTLPFSYYTGLLQALKGAFPGVHLKAWTMVELDWFARIAKKPLDETIAILKDAGMDSCPGGGAEIFAKRSHDLIARNKMSGERWLAVARAVHRQGIRTNATILYGHVESPAERVDHLLRLRDLQDETGGFQAIVPLAFHPENTWLRDVPPTTGRLDLSIIALSRLLLDNFDHVKAYWIQLGPKITELALGFGADDVGGTYVHEEITHAAGAATAEGMTRTEMEALIRRAGRRPVRTDTYYRPVESAPR